MVAHGAQKVRKRLNTEVASLPYQPFLGPKYQPRSKKASEVEMRASMFTQASTVKNKSGHPDLWALGLTHLHGNPGSPPNAKPQMG